MPARHLSATAQANILQNILQQAGVEVLQRTVKELFGETGLVARSVYAAFAAYSLAADLSNNSQRAISPLESYAGQIVSTFIMGGAKIENAVMPR